MISDRVLDLAVERGLIVQGQALALRSLAREVEGKAPDEVAEAVDEERLRFVTGFADIFVTLGIALFLGAAAYLVAKSGTPALTAGALAAMSWGLAEFFTRRRRMAFPSIVLLVVFACSSFVTLSLLLGGDRSEALSALLGWTRPWAFGLAAKPSEAGPVAWAALGTAALTALHYWRFRVPITVAAGVFALALAFVTILTGMFPALMAKLSTAVILVLGLVIFALAMRFDLSDPKRETRRTDIAFWLHLLAAPMIVHSVFHGIGVTSRGLGLSAAVLVLLIFAGLAIVAVLVDRRALLVSGLVYAGIAFGKLFQTIGFKDQTGPVTVLVLGAFVLLLSAGWTRLRAVVIGQLPDEWAARLPAHAPR